MNAVRIDLLTTRCCSPMNTWARVRGLLVVELERERIEGQIAVLEETMAAIRMRLGKAGMIRNAEARYAYEILASKIAALRKGLSE